jgi:replicative DNA helicase Mcm
MEAPKAPHEYKGMWDNYIAESQRGADISGLDPDGYEFHEPVFLTIDFGHLMEWAGYLVEPLMDDPDNCLRGAEFMVRERIGESLSEDEPCGIRIVNPPADMHITVNAITANHVNRMWAVEGTVRSCGPLESLVVKALYECDRHHEFFVDQKELFIKPPSICPECVHEGQKRPSLNLSLKPDRSICRDVRLFDLQDQEGGLTDTSIMVMALDDLAVKVKTGDRLRVTGVIHLENRDERKNKATFGRYIRANNIEWQEVDYGRLQLTGEEEQEIRELAARPDVWEVLASSVAPPILGMEDVKKACVLQMFSIAEKYNDIRRCVNILLFGDRGTAKSEIMSDVRRIVGRGVTASGNNATVAGITAGVEKDERLGGKMVVRPGAIVLSHGGILVMDELEKTRPDVQDALHTAMEQQIVHKTAVGINMDMDCACAIIAAANPKGSSFQENLAIAEQTKLDAALLERFDLAFICRMHEDPKVRKAVKTHIARGYSDAKGNPITHRPVSIDLFRKYLLYANKVAPNPILTPEAEAMIMEADDKAKGKCLESGWPYGYRQFHAHLRLALAAARMRLSPTIDVIDAQHAIEMFDAFIKGVGGGKGVDLGRVYGTRTKASLEKRRWIVEAVQALTKDGGLASLDELEELGVEAKAFIDENEVRRFVRRMTEDEKTLFQPRGPGHGYALVNPRGMCE